MSKINKHWVSLGLVFAAAAIGVSGHDGWGWCLFLIFVMECV
jgi:hypothetical protein